MNQAIAIVAAKENTSQSIIHLHLLMNINLQSLTNHMPVFPVRYLSIIVSEMDEIHPFDFILFSFVFNQDLP